MKRRFFLSSITASLAYNVCSRIVRSEVRRVPVKYTMDLCPGRIGVKVDQHQAIALAHRYGFQSVEPIGSFLATLDSSELVELRGALKEKNLVWGCANLDVNFRSDESEFQSGLRSLPAIASGFQRAGVSRVGKSLSPSSNDLTYLANFKQHSIRLRAIAKILGDYGVRFGLEYVGPKTSWASKKYAFVHTMAETKELILAVGAPNVGIVLDSWHWYCAGETIDDLMTLKNQDIVAVDLNDAPLGIERDQQIDNRRELPMATNVIDVRGFIEALDKLDYDGPIRAEPFNQSLNAMENDEAVKFTAEAMKRALPK
ncbi:MAG: sugar phosphate isomerase/epimerase family protein [Pirellulaceae bacterium]|nr:sugar phosphate isomerase/epimerase family protein [Pirellulaceae bacterium]